MLRNKNVVIILSIFSQSFTEVNTITVFLNLNIEKFVFKGKKASDKIR